MRPRSLPRFRAGATLPRSAPPPLWETSRAAAGASYRRRRIRSASSTSPSRAALTGPSRRRRRRRETDRMASQRTALSRSNPPSGGDRDTWDGIGRSVEVIGNRITRSAGPLLNSSSEITTAGRRPACSWPMVGARFTSQSSPRRGGLLNAGALSSLSFFLAVAKAPRRTREDHRRACNPIRPVRPASLPTPGFVARPRNRD
jgi:hypothetical protein